MIEIRPYVDSDYETLVKWWNDWGWTAPQKDFLPDVGMIVYDKETPIVGGFLYITNSKVIWLEWIISNKEYTNREIRKKAIFLLLESLLNIAKYSGYKYVYSLLKHEGLIKTYESLGFNKGDTATELIKVL